MGSDTHFRETEIIYFIFIFIEKRDHGTTVDPVKIKSATRSYSPIIIGYGELGVQDTNKVTTNGELVECFCPAIANRHHKPFDSLRELITNRLTA